MPQETTFTFLQISELLLDSKLVSKVLTLSPAQRQERNEECLELLIRLCKEAGNRNVDAILVPGNLWDATSITNSTAARLIEVFGSIPQVAVVLVPGPFDPYSPDGLHNSGVLAARGLKPWTDNVLPLTSTSFETVLHPTRKDVTFTARAMNGNGQNGAFSTGFPALSRMPIRILLLPARVPGLEDNLETVKHAVQPYSLAIDQLDAAGFSYTAFSGHCNLHQVRNSHGKLLGAYSGSLTGRTLQEIGPRHAIWGRVITDGSNDVIVSLDPVEVDCRKVVAATCSITGVKPEQIHSTIQGVMSKEGVRTRDIVLLKVTGMYPHGDPPQLLDQQLKDSYYHLILDDRTRPDYLGARADERTTEGKFIQTLLEMKHRAELKGGALPDTEYGAELSTKVIEDALYYGLQALKERKVAVRNVD
jgi:DNA repair exonuclease SbcCD nuclease subunit